MKKHGILNRELAAVFASLGHTDQVTIADCGLPIPNGVRCIDLSYKVGQPAFLEILEAVLGDLEVETAIQSLKGEDVEAFIPVELDLIKK